VPMTAPGTSAARALTTTGLATTAARALTTTRPGTTAARARHCPRRSRLVPGRSLHARTHPAAPPNGGPTTFQPSRGPLAPYDGVTAGLGVGKPQILRKTDTDHEERAPGAPAPAPGPHPREAL